MASISSPLFTPIPETDREGEDEEEGGGQEERHETKGSATNSNQHRTPTPLHPASSSSSKLTPRNPHRSATASSAGDFAVSCNSCRPSSRDKTSAVPLDPYPSSNRLLRSLLPSLRRTPPDEDFRLATAELSRKLAIAVRRRDEALLESSRLKSSLYSLYRKLDRLESHCLELQSALDRCSSSSHAGSLPVDPFLRAVSDSRAAVGHLAAALSAHLHPTKSLDLLAVESLLNRLFYADFELGFALGSDPEPLDPVARCELNRKRFESVRDLGWEEVLSRGTRHYSQGLSRFCDRTMGEVVGMLGWGAAQRVWPEGLLQAYFGAAKGVWMVHLLARSVHPAVPILRVGQGAKFEPEYMEDMTGWCRVAQPISVRVMVAPGFYVYSTSCGMVKCKVLRVYDKNNNNNKHRQYKNTSENNVGTTNSKTDSLL